METIDGVTWLTRKEAAAHCRVKSERTIDRWAEEGKITRYRADGIQSVRFKRSELDALFVAEVSEIVSPTCNCTGDAENTHVVGAEGCILEPEGDPFAD